MIATNIDGSSGSSTQLFDLLTLVANPTAYQEKIKALETATAENKKYVELVAPASDILALKEKIKADAQAAATALEDAKNKAQALISQAEAQAVSIFRDADNAAKDVKQQAQKVLENAYATKAAADKALENAQYAQNQADSAYADIVAKEVELEEALAEAKNAKANALAQKAEIIAKHEEFIRTL